MLRVYRLLTFGLAAVLSICASGEIGAAADPPTPSPILQTSLEMQELLQTRINRATSELEQLRQVVRLIFAEDGVGFEYSRGTTQTAEETFRTGQGNCLSFTNLVIALAREIGLNAHYQEVEIPPSWDKHGQIVTTAQHVNAAVLIGTQLYEVDLAANIDRIRISSRIVSDERGMAHFYSNKGVDAFSQGDIAQALFFFRESVNVDSTSPFAWSNLAAAQSASHDYENAEASYLESLQHDPERMSTLDNLARLYSKMGRVKQASNLRKKVEDYRRKNPFYHLSLGDRAYSASRFEEAISHYREAVKRRPNDDSFLFALARAYFAAGDFAHARECLEKAEKKSSDPELQERYSEKLRILASLP